MELDIGSLLLSMVIGSVGMVLFLYGKKQTRVPHLVAGIVLMAYPYFVANLWAMGAIAAGILVILWGVVRLGH